MYDINNELSACEKTSQIPTAPSPSKACICSVAAILLSTLGIAVWYWAPAAVTSWLGGNPSAESLLKKNNSLSLINLSFQLFGVVGLICLCAGLASLARKSITYTILRIVLIGVYVAVVFYVGIVWHALFSILHAELSLNGAEQQPCNDPHSLVEIFMARTGNGSVCILVANHAAADLSTQFLLRT